MLIVHIQILHTAEIDMRGDKYTYDQGGKSHRYDILNGVTFLHSREYIFF